MATYPNHIPVSPPDIDALPDSALLRLPSIIALVQCSRSSWFAWVRLGHAPQPIRIGLKAVAWKVGEIRAFMRGRDRGPAPGYTCEGGKASQAKRRADKAALIGEVAEETPDNHLAEHRGSSLEVGATRKTHDVKKGRK